MNAIPRDTHVDTLPESVIEAVSADDGAMSGSRGDERRNDVDQPDVQDMTSFDTKYNTYVQILSHTREFNTRIRSDLDADGRRDLERELRVLRVEYEDAAHEPESDVKDEADLKTIRRDIDTVFQGIEKLLPQVL